jgi:hypothetical protein
MTWPALKLTNNGGGYFGRIIALKEPLSPAGHEIGLEGQPKVDPNNPDQCLGDRLVIDLNPLRNVVIRASPKAVINGTKAKCIHR